MKRDPKQAIPLVFLILVGIALMIAGGIYYDSKGRNSVTYPIVDGDKISTP